ncbi:Cof-type HAD-IIB family hydrolase [Nocardioides sp.]|uniref:Cof-type HAD-IIB family hydrolase n=1 Tax=Nocardioides sp. TaxID=35761 RepID=UPI002ED83A00
MQRDLSHGPREGWNAEPRLFALDVDGTLLRSDGSVADETLTAIQHVRSRGVEVVLVTSRGAAAVRPVATRLGMGAADVFISAQGALTGSWAQGSRLLVQDQQPCPVTRARAVVEAAVTAGFSVSWFAGEHWYVSHLDATIEEEIREIGVVPEVRPLLAEERGPDKLMVIGEPDRLEVLRNLAEHLPSGLTVQVSNPNTLEITRSGVDKATGLARYCTRRGLPLRDVVAIGDGPNDLDMFARVGTSIAPANARPEVLRAATLLTRSNDDHGVALALLTLVP